MLNDLELCISCINELLKKRNLKQLNRSTYKEVFSFPVKDYYAAVGFNFQKEDFAVPAREFIDLYNRHVHACPLHKPVLEVLAHFKNKGTRQFILSAMKQNMLEATLKSNKIFHFFEYVAGLDDHYAVSKIERGQQLIAQNNIGKEDAVIVGDTIHDFEVARKLGIRCILIADGHQSKNRLKKTRAQVIDGLDELTYLI